MQPVPSKKYTALNTQTGSHSMGLTEYARWLSLLEGIEFVGRHCAQDTIKRGREIDWIKPLAFQKYIDERYQSMEYEICELDKMPEQDILKLHAAALAAPEECFN